jgi:hypothetical protein
VWLTAGTEPVKVTVDGLSEATCKVTEASKVITVTEATPKVRNSNLNNVYVVGALVTGTNIPAGTTVSSIEESKKEVTLSNNVSKTVSAEKLIFIALPEIEVAKATTQPIPVPAGSYVSLIFAGGSPSWRWTLN